MEPLSQVSNSIIKAYNGINSNYYYAENFEVECGEAVIERYINESNDRLFSRWSWVN